MCALFVFFVVHVCWLLEYSSSSSPFFSLPLRWWCCRLIFCCCIVQSSRSLPAYLLRMSTCSFVSIFVIIFFLCRLSRCFVFFFFWLSATFCSFESNNGLFCFLIVQSVAPWTHSRTQSFHLKLSTWYQYTKNVTLPSVAVQISR